MTSYIGLSPPSLPPPPSHFFSITCFLHHSLPPPPSLHFLKPPSLLTLKESIRSGKAEAHLSDPKHEAKVTAGEAEVQEEVRLEEEAALAKAAEAEAAAAPSEESAPMETEVAANGAVNGK